MLRKRRPPKYDRHEFAPAIRPRRASPPRVARIILTRAVRLDAFLAPREWRGKTKGTTSTTAASTGEGGGAVISRQAALIIVIL